MIETVKEADRYEVIVTNMDWRGGSVDQVALRARGQHRADERSAQE